MVAQRTKENLYFKVKEKPKMFLSKEQRKTEGMRDIGWVLGSGQTGSRA